MAADTPIPRYGVHRQSAPADGIAEASESLRLLGYAVLASGIGASELGALRTKFDAVREAVLREHGADALRAINEHNTIRCPLAHDRAFLDLARCAPVLGLCEAMLGPGFILNQQNGVVNPANEARYSQGAYHRDLPYQHFTSSRPIAINALFCLDDFTADNGATLVVPASHKEEALPSDPLIQASERGLEAPAGSFLVLDAMTYHRGGPNRTARDRRAVNHVYSIGLLRQQIDLPAYLGDKYPADARERQFLGYDYRSPVSDADYYSGRRRKLGL